ncbi:MAG: hypothetical protein J5793_01230 [Clostridia bacterium]|nr:hypothetical protein [Clostridia bacterium]
MFGNKELQGAWEERGVVGTRIEIEGKKLTVLWQGSPVLETSFSVSKGENGVLNLDLKETGLRYKGDNRDYAQVTAITFENGRLIYDHRFPITGDSREILDKTANSRFGDFDIADGVLKELSGKWYGKEFPDTLIFKKDTLTINGETRKIHALTCDTGYLAPGEYLIADADPGRHSIFRYAEMRFRAGVIDAVIPVCDAPSFHVTFTREKKD